MRSPHDSAHSTGGSAGAAARSEPRIAPLPRDRWDDAVVAAFRAGIPGPTADRFLSEGEPDSLRMPNALATMVRNPQLAEQWFRYNDVILRRATVEPRLRELMIMRVAWRTRSAYEWVQHVRLAPRFDITAEEIAAIDRGAGAGCWSTLEAALLTATDELIDHYRITDETWAMLAQHLDDRQLVEVVFIVGTYTCLAMVFNSLGVELDPELYDVPAPALPED